MSGGGDWAQNTQTADWLKQQAPLNAAAYVSGRLASGNTTPVMLAAEFETSIATISRFRRLCACRHMLPETWRGDLGSEDTLAYPGPAIRLGHWIEVMPCFGKLGAPAHVLQLMEKCHAERWSANRLKRELKKLSAGKSDGRPS